VGSRHWTRLRWPNERTHLPHPGKSTRPQRGMTLTALRATAYEESLRTVLAAVQRNSDTVMFRYYLQTCSRSIGVAADASVEGTSKDGTKTEYDPTFSAKHRLPLRRPRAAGSNCGEKGI
jgi:hypothetical protein